MFVVSAPHVQSCAEHVSLTPRHAGSGLPALGAATGASLNATRVGLAVAVDGSASGRADGSREGVNEGSTVASSEGAAVLSSEGEGAAGGSVLALLGALLAAVGLCVGSEGACVGGVGGSVGIGVGLAV